MNTSRTAIRAAVCLALLSPAGCGGGNSARPQKDDDQISALVTGTPDKALNPTAAKGHFVVQPDKATMRRYAQLSFEPIGEPSISGDTATISVRVTAPDGTARGEVEWAFVKQEGKWRLQSAPLP